MPSVKGKGQCYSGCLPYVRAGEVARAARPEWVPQEDMCCVRFAFPNHPSQMPQGQKGVAEGGRANVEGFPEQQAYPRGIEA